MTLEPFISGAVEAITAKIVDSMLRWPHQSTDVTRVTPAEIRTRLDLHLSLLDNWSRDLTTPGITSPRSLVSAFVEPFFASGQRGSLAYDGDTALPLATILASSHNLVIIGDPGAGKTSSLKFIARGLLSSLTPTSHGPVPLLVRVRDHVTGLIELSRAKEPFPLAVTVLGLLGLNGTLPPPDKRPAGSRDLPLNWLKMALQAISGVVLIDGLDEAPPSVRTSILTEMQQLILGSVGYRVILTTRGGSLAPHVENARTWTLLPLAPEQIAELARGWLEAELTPGFMAALDKSPYAGAEVRPLLLAHLAALFKKSRRLPDRPKDVYRQLVGLLLQDWDDANSIVRTSGYLDFGPPQKKDFLTALAYQLTLSSGSNAFSCLEITEAYELVAPSAGLPSGHALPVAREVEEHSGLLLNVAHDSYEFAHRSFQEYLAAEYLLGLPSLPSSLILLPNEIAIATSLSSASDQYFIAVVTALLTTPHSVAVTTFTEDYLARLVIERVTFPASSGLSLAALVLCARVYMTAEGTRTPKERPVESSTVRDFAKLPSVRRDVLDLLQRACGPGKPNKRLVSVPPSFTAPLEIPSGLRKVVFEDYQAIIPIDTSLWYE